MRFGPTPGAIWQINLRFVYAVFLYGLAWVYWPTDPQWWFFKVLAVMMIFVATVEIIKFLIRIGQHLKQDRDIIEYAQLGEAAKGDRLASNDAEQRAGTHGQ